MKRKTDETAAELLRLKNLTVAVEHHTHQRVVIPPPYTANPDSSALDALTSGVARRCALRHSLPERLAGMPEYQQQIIKAVWPSVEDDVVPSFDTFRSKEAVAAALSQHNQTVSERKVIEEGVTRWMSSANPATESDRMRSLEDDEEEAKLMVQRADISACRLQDGLDRLASFGDVLSNVTVAASRVSAANKQNASTNTSVCVLSEASRLRLKQQVQNLKILPPELFELYELPATQKTLPKSETASQPAAVPVRYSEAEVALVRCQQALSQKSERLAQAMLHHENHVRKTSNQIRQLRTHLESRVQLIHDSYQEIKETLRHHGLSEADTPRGDDASTPSEPNLIQCFRDGIDAILADMKEELQHDLPSSSTQREQQQDAEKHQKLTLQAETLSSLQKEVHNLNEKAALASSVLIERDAEVRRLERQVAACNQEMQNLQDQARKLAERCEWQQQQVDKMTREGESWEKERLCLLHSLEEAKLVVDGAQRRNARLALTIAEVDRLRKQLDTAESLLSSRTGAQPALGQAPPSESLANSMMIQPASANVCNAIVLELLGLAGSVGLALRQTRNTLRNDVGSAARNAIHAQGTTLIEAVHKALKNIDKASQQTNNGDLVQSLRRQFDGEQQEWRSAPAIRDPAEAKIEELQRAVAQEKGEHEEDFKQLTAKIRSLQEQLDAREKQLGAAQHIATFLSKTVQAAMKLHSVEFVSKAHFERPSWLDTVPAHSQVDDCWIASKQVWLAVKQRLLADSGAEDAVCGFSAPIKQQVEALFRAPERSAIRGAIYLIRKYSGVVQALTSPLLQVFSTLPDEHTRVWVRKLCAVLTEHKRIEKDIIRFLLAQCSVDAVDRKAGDILKSRADILSAQSDALFAYNGNNESVPEDESNDRAKRIRILCSSIVQKLMQAVDALRLKMALRQASQWECFAKLAVQRMDTLSEAVPLMQSLAVLCEKALQPPPPLDEQSSVLEKSVCESVEGIRQQLVQLEDENTSLREALDAQKAKMEALSAARRTDNEKDQIQVESQGGKADAAPSRSPHARALAARRQTTTSILPRQRQKNAAPLARLESESSAVLQRVAELQYRVNQLEGWGANLLQVLAQELDLGSLQVDEHAANTVLCAVRSRKAAEYEQPTKLEPKETQVAAVQVSLDVCSSPPRKTHTAMTQTESEGVERRRALPTEKPRTPTATACQSVALEEDSKRARQDAVRAPPATEELRVETASVALQTAVFTVALSPRLSVGRRCEAVQTDHSLLLDAICSPSFAASLVSEISVDERDLPLATAPSPTSSLQCRIPCSSCGRSRKDTLVARCQDAMQRHCADVLSRSAHRREMSRLSCDSARCRGGLSVVLFPTAFVDTSHSSNSSDPCPRDLELYPPKRHRTDRS